MFAYNVNQHRHRLYVYFIYNLDCIMSDRKRSKTSTRDALPTQPSMSQWLFKAASSSLTSSTVPVLPSSAMSTMTPISFNRTASLDFSDKAVLTHDQIFQRGPIQPSPRKGEQFSRYDGKQLRYFNEDWYKIYPWCEFSETQNAILCFPCRLFGNGPWTKEGCGKFSNLSLSGHAKTDSHERNVVRLSEYRLSTSTNNVFAQVNEQHAMNLTSREIEKRNLCAVLSRIFDSVGFLAKQNLAFRGHDESASSLNRGNFKEMLSVIAKYDSTLNTHLVDGPKNAQYTSPEMQNDFIKLIGNELIAKFVAEVNAASYFTLQLDSTPGKSHDEQVSMILRYVSTQGSVCERFFGFFECARQTGESLRDLVLESLSQLHIPIENCRGQCHDGAANMSGHIKGLQALIQEHAPLALFTHCAAHRLNLVVVSACCVNTKAKLFFGTIQNCYTFICASPVRYKFFDNCVKEAHMQLQQDEGDDGASLTLKPICDVRWNCQYRAVTAVKQSYAPLLQALEEIANHPQTNSTAAVEANGLSEQLQKFEFIFCLLLFEELLLTMNADSKTLQNEGIDLCTMVDTIEVLVGKLNVRRQNEFDRFWQASVQFARTHDIDVPELVPGPKRRISVRVDENAQNQHFHQTMKDSCRVDIFFSVLDHALRSITDRFSDISKPVISSIAHMFPKRLINPAVDVLEHIRFLGLHYETDFHTIVDRLVSQFESFLGLCAMPRAKSKLVECTSLEDVLQFMSEMQYSTMFPFVERLFRLAMTLGITTSKNERSFSKLKLIQTYLRSTMGQDRLSSLALMSIERIAVDDMFSGEIDTIIRKFVDDPHRRINQKS